MKEQLLRLLVKYEGLKLKPYFCSEHKLTIGIGRNLQDRGITEAEAYLLADHDLDSAIAEASKFEWYPKLNQSRQIVVVLMIQNIGYTGFLKFAYLIAAIRDENFATASKEMLNSLWASQVGKRAVELAAIMKTGVL